MHQISHDKPPIKILPPRRKRFRALRLLVLFLAAIALCHLVWGEVARRQFDRRIAELRSAGEPIDERDFFAPPVPASQNTAIDLSAAGAAIGHDRDWGRFEWVPVAIPWDQKELEAVERVILSRRSALDCLESAFSKPQLDWGMDPHVPAAAHLPGATEARDCVNLLGRAAVLAHQRGDQRQTLHHLRQMLFVARAIDQQGTIISHLVADGIVDMAADIIILLAPDLRIDSHDPTVAAEARKLLDELLDERAARDGLMAAMRRERLDMLQFIDSMSAGREVFRDPRAEPWTVAQHFCHYLSKPLRFQDQRLATEYISAIIDALRRSHDYRGYRAIAPGPQRELAEHGWRHLIFDDLLPAPYRIQRFMINHYHAIADRRLAAVALAVRAYALEHDGRRPPTLDALVAVHLPAAVPTDPFSPCGAPLRYRQDGERSIVYSVGPDGVDDDGSEQPLPQYARLTRPPWRWETLDGVVHLARMPRVSFAAPDDQEVMRPAFRRGTPELVK